jgi:hypothetical protein
MKDLFISSRTRLRALTVCASFCLTLPLLAQVPAPNKRGEEIYKKLCLDCHGKNGEGVKDKYDEPLHGNRSTIALAKRIERTMPDDNVGACVGDDAKAVAAYIFDAFYSPHAQARLKPPEFDLARLTIPQYRTSVADLVGRFRPGFDRAPLPKRGLSAVYSGLALEKPAPAPVPVPAPPPAVTPPPAPGKSSSPTPAPPPVAATPKPPAKPPEEKKPERTRVDRTDATVNFKLGAASPAPDTMSPEEFTMRWEGSVIADETGTYEFIVRSENGIRLSVNDMKKVLIDGWVSSGPDVREMRKSLFLLGGRSYPILLEFFKFKEKSASIQLLWKPPHGVVEIIPEDHLWPLRLRETFVVKTTFPADDRSVGYERGTGVSKAWDQATTDAALEVMDHVDSHLEELSGAKPKSPDRVEKLQQFARRFVETAFRRPLSDADYQHLIVRPFKASKTPELAIKRIVLFTLKSPRFLYPDLPLQGPPDGYDFATRLALSLWDSIPDQALLQAAAQGKLTTRDQITSQANRMLGDPRAKAKLAGFFHHWLELERAEAIAKDAKAFPTFDLATLADLRTSLMLFLDKVVWSDKSDYRELLQADYLFLNERLAKLYDKSVAGNAFQQVAFDPKQRAGVVTHPYLLAAFAYSKQTSPIHRGVFLTRNIVGMTLKPPPDAVAFEDAKFDAHLTMREKITELTKNTSCMGCHATINPLGFSLENYDAIGRWRTKENNKVIDASSDFSTNEGQTVHLTGARDLVKFAVENPDGHRAFIHQLFQHTAKQAVNVYGPDTLEKLRRSFAASGFNVRRLLGDIAVMTASRGLRQAPVVKPPPPSAPATAKPLPTATPKASAPATPPPTPPTAVPASKPPPASQPKSPPVKTTPSPVPAPAPAAKP